MLNVFKVRIYPNSEQELALAKNFGCCRFVWNYYLDKTNTRLLAEVREQGTGNREQKEELRLKASKTLYF
jgi:transposase